MGCDKHYMDRNLKYFANTSCPRISFTCVLFNRICTSYRNYSFIIHILTFLAIYACATDATPPVYNAFYHRMFAVWFACSSLSFGGPNGDLVAIYSCEYWEINVFVFN